jgi:thiamine-phosphate pyrophosphorylase
MPSFLSYFITDPKYSLSQTFKAIEKFKPDFVCYRNKEYFDKDEIINFAKFAKKHSKVFINIDSLKDETLLKYFDGIHITSSKLDMIDKFKDKTIIASTHSEKEIQKAKKADFITFSPIFDSKGRKGLGIQRLNEICLLHPKVIALGGIIGKKEIEEVKKSKASGFASIRYFYENLIT